MAAISEGEGILALSDWFTSPYNQGDVQHYLITIQREFLLRFPKAEGHDEVHWLLAYREATSFIDYPFDDYPVKTFTYLVENSLNSGQIQMGILREWLHSKGFHIAARYDAPNLFGDRQPTVVLQIEARREGWLTKDAVLVLSSMQPGKYHVTSLRDKWLTYNPTSSGGEEIISVGD